jgi:hypothetical protein
MSTHGGGGGYSELSVLAGACRCEQVREGDDVEVVVLSKSMYCEDFEVIRDVYVPTTGAWLCEYPFVKRSDFERISAEIYRSRAAAGEDGAAQASDERW